MTLVRTSPVSGRGTGETPLRIITWNTVIRGYRVLSELFRAHNFCQNSDSWGNKHCYNYGVEHSRKKQDSYKVLRSSINIGKTSRNQSQNDRLNPSHDDGVFIETLSRIHVFKQNFRVLKRTFFQAF